jgi:predicted transcriptional regulator
VASRRAAFTAGLALFLLVQPVAASEVHLQADFARPAQIQGNLGVERAQWALVVFRGGPAAFNFTLPSGATETNQTVLDAERPSSDPPALTLPLELPETSRDLPSQLDGTLGFSDAWASLFIEAGSISLSIPGAGGNLDRVFAGEVATAHVPRARDTPDSATGVFFLQTRHLPGDGVVLSAESQQAFVPVALGIEARDVRSMAWHNATVECQSSMCPDAGRPWVMNAGTTRLQRLSYMQLRTNSGTLRGGGQAWAIATGGPSIQASVDGHIRLPDAHLLGACPSGTCPNPAGRTFPADGHITFDGLSPSPSRLDHLSAQLGGNFAAAAFDESPVSAFTTAAEVGVGALGLAGLAIFVRFLAGLFARSSRPPALQSERRQALFEEIKENPGLSFRGLQRLLGWPTGTLRHHAERLLDERIIVAEPYRNTVRYFENHGRYKDTWRTVAPLQNPDVRRLLDWLQQQPETTQGGVTQHVLAWGWDRNKARRCLRELQEAGLLASRREGRRVLYQILSVRSQAA